jgi:hypothetical protein
MAGFFRVTIYAQERMAKDFDRWNEKKKALNREQEPVYYHEGEIWWAHLGVNIGFEIDGKADNSSPATLPEAPPPVRVP